MKIGYKHLSCFRKINNKFHRGEKKKDGERKPSTGAQFFPKKSHLVQLVYYQ